MKKLLLFSFMCLLGVAVDTFAQFDTSKVIIGYTPEQRRYLRLFAFSNNFGYAGVEYHLADIRLTGNRLTQNIAFRPTVQSHCQLRGNPEQGEDQKLKEVCRTDDFVVNKNMHINFHRIMMIYTFCCYEKDSVTGISYWDDPKYKELPEQTRTWGCPKGSILDSSEWVIELASASTGERLFVVDSVGIMPNPETNYSIPYGTNPLNSDITVVLPDYLVGKNVFLRVSPRRYGPTPAGMGLYEFYSCTNSSVFHSMKDGIRIGHAGNLTEQIDSYVFNKCLEYIDSLISVGECVPIDLMNSYGTSPAQHDFLKQKYPQCYTDEAFDKFIKKYDERINKIKTSPAQSKIQSIRYLDKTNEFAVMLNSQNASNDLRYNLASLDNSQSVSGTIGKIGSGEHSFNVSLPRASKGAYNLSIEDESGALLGQTTVIVE